jgi:beta-lactamase regulating signal transducer with metallopeptidase domain
MLFAYCFLMTLLHSLWQASIQALLYATVSKTILQKTIAAAKRNLLLLQIGIQVVLSAVTFTLYYLQPEGQIQSTFQYYAAMGISLKPYLYSAAPWMIAFYFIWLGGKIINLIMAWRQFSTQYKTGLEKPPIDLKLFTKITANHMGIKKQVQLWLSNNIHTPITFGHFKPVILLPVALINQVSLQQAEALVIHELTHIKVKDYLLNWLLAIAETIYFFNPFIGYLSNQAKLEREKYCDTNVLNFGKHPIVYAETLLLAAKLQQEQIRWQLAAVGNKKQLLKRISFFTSNAPFQAKKTSAGIGLAPLLLAMAFFVTATVMSVLPNSNESTRKGQAALASVFPAVALMPNNAQNAITTIDVGETPLAITALPQPLPIKAPIIVKKEANIVAHNIKKPSRTTDNIAGPSFVYPEGLQAVSYNDGTMVREFMVEEETPGTGVKTIKIFVLQYKNGNWVLEPKWMATSRTISIDTALLRLDSLRIRFVDAQ